MGMIYTYHNRSTRVFTLGIGREADEKLVQGIEVLFLALIIPGLAVAGKGDWVMIQDVNQVLVGARGSSID